MLKIYTIRNHILIVLVILCKISAAQSSDDEDVIYKAPDNYDFTRPARIIKCQNIDGFETSDTVEVPRGAKFYLVEMLPDGSALIQFWLNSEISGWDTIFVYENARNRELDIRKTFKILGDDFETKTRRRYSTILFQKRQVAFSGTSITGGVVIIPFKFRPAIKVNGERRGFDFSKDLQLGITGGLRQRISKYNPYHVNILFNIGISSVTMDDYNTNNTLTSTTDIAALTYSFGFVADFKKIQFGGFLGWDKVSDRSRNNWIYQGKPWWSIGFGYSIFSTSTASNPGRDKPSKPL